MQRLAIVAVFACVVGLAWLAAGSLSGRGFGFSNRDCEMSAGRGPDGVLEAQARCRWPIPPDQIEPLLAAWGDQARYFGNVAESTVLESTANRMLVRQVHRASGISDREVVMECVTETVAGGRRYRWNKAPDQSRASGQRVEVAVHEGYWQVAPAADGSIVEYHMRYLPGGSVPSFLVSMFLSSGMQDVLTDLRRAAESRQVAARDVR